MTKPSFQIGWTALENAKLLFQAGGYNGAADRAYYSMYEMAVELLLTAGLTPPKTHQGVHVLLSQHFIKTGLLEGEYADHLSFVESIRLVADYSREALSKQDAQEAIDLAEKFVTRISGYIAGMK